MIKILIKNIKNLACPPSTQDLALNTDFQTKFDMVVMQNSFAHQPNPTVFLENIKKSPT